MTAGKDQDSAAVPASPAGQPVPRAPLRDTGPFSAPARTNTGQRRQSGLQVEEPMPGPIRGRVQDTLRLPRTRLGWGTHRVAGPTPIPGHPRSGSMQAGIQETATLKSGETGQPASLIRGTPGSRCLRIPFRVPRRPASPSPAKPPASPDARSRRRVDPAPATRVGRITRPPAHLPVQSPCRVRCPWSRGSQSVERKEAHSEGVP